MEITKQTLIDLVKACAKDPNMINGTYIPVSYGKALNKGIEIRENYTDVFRYEYSYNGINLTDFYHINSKTKKLKFEYLPTNCDRQINYSIRVLFDKIPEITIGSNYEYVLHEVGKLPAKNGFWKSTQVDFKIKKIDLKFELRCGNYVFELTLDETKDLYDMIVIERNSYLKTIEDTEIKHRLEKYL